MNERHPLEVRDLCLRFGGLAVLREVSLEVRAGEILAIIGPNGAGKTSLINCITGFYRPQQGRILFHGQDITRTATHKIARLGISRTFQKIELYTGLSTLDNLMAARHVHIKRGALSACLFFGPTAREEIEHRVVVERIIDLLELAPIRKKQVGLLPYGQRKRVELGRALATEPRLLFLDEPMTGMNVEEKEDMARFVLDIAELRQIPIVLVEHDMEIVMDISDRAVVLDFGQKIAEGEPRAIIRHPEVIRAYIGEEEDEEDVG
ncbi:MAG: ABC transporter ATP-binding protein [Proteobacteria bacterium]|nr:ABC transporter ATP-binding protein [Pseudomonadota bacterium]